MNINSVNIYLKEKLNIEFWILFILLCFKYSYIILSFVFMFIVLFISRKMKEEIRKICICCMDDLLWFY